MKTGSWYLVRLSSSSSSFISSFSYSSFFSSFPSPSRPPSDLIPFQFSFVLTFLYFYIYAVNYVRGGSVPAHPVPSALPQRYIDGYVADEVQVRSQLRPRGP